MTRSDSVRVIVSLLAAFVLGLSLGMHLAGAAPADDYEIRIYGLAREVDTGGVEPSPTPEPTSEGRGMRDEEAPTATPTIVVASTKWFPERVERWRGLVAEVMPAEMVDVWLDIIDCESGGNPNAVGRAGERGLTQIHPVHGALWASAFDPRANLEAAYELSGGGYWLQPWTCARVRGHWE